MKKKTQEVAGSIDTVVEEPIGIVISSGDRSEVRSVFSAYIWGPAPEPASTSASKVA